MSAEPIPLNQALEAALTYGRLGFRVFPCLPGQKVPAVKWKDAATADTEAIKRLFSDPHVNIGLACGPQPNDLNLLTIDIDAHHSGLETWRSLMREHGRDGIEGTATHLTPNGGWHVYVNMPSEFRNSRNTLGEGIDTRASGGYVIVPPSRLIDANGEVRLYRGNGDLALITGAPVFDAPLWVVEALTPEPPPPPRERRGGQMDSPLDWFRKNADLQDEIVQDGWQVHSYHGNEVNYTRPGKPVRDGKSAVFHPEDDGSLVIFTTEVDPGLAALGTPTADRTGVTINVVKYVAWRDFRCSYEDMARYVRDRLMPNNGSQGAVYLAPSLVGDSRQQSLGELDELYPAPEWYRQREWMAACQQMAQAVGGSPAAHVLAYLVRWATLVPPGYTIPPINGAPSSFDLLGVVAGTSGSGKTSAMTNAEYALPVLRTDMRMGLGLGSGEGIAEMFYGNREVVDEESGKKSLVRDRIFAGVNFSISEGLIFADLAERGGTTHVTRFCDGWSGATLSTANARQDTFRHIERGQYRLTAMMGIQLDRAHELMTDKAASQGFVGRLLFVWAEEPRVRPRPSAPEFPVLPVPLELAIPATRTTPKIFQPQMLSYPEAVIVECQDANDARAGQDVPVEEHHHDLLRLKVAGVLALMEGRMTVQMDDWAIATHLVSTSAAIRSWLHAHKRKQDRDRGHAAAVARGELKFVEKSATERRYVATLSQRLVDRTPSDGWTVRQAAHALTSKDTRHRFGPALDMAKDNGFLKVEDERIVLL